MELIGFLSTALVCGAGLCVGFLLAGVTGAEVRSGMRALQVLMEAVLAMLVGIALVPVVPWPVALAAACVVFVVLASVSCARLPSVLGEIARVVRACRSVYVLYVLLALDLLWGARAGLGLTVPLLIFLYGLPAGSVVRARGGSLRSVVLPSVLFVSACAVLFFVL